MKIKVAFLDRDGIINKKSNTGDYILHWDDFVFTEFIYDFLKYLVSKGYKLIIITNQRCVSLGLISLNALEEIHSRMIYSFLQSSIEITAIYVCPHGLDVCSCRKPKPGLVYRAQEEFDIDLNASILIGDSLNEVVLGELLGIKTFYIGDDLGDYTNSFTSINSLKEFLKNNDGEF